MSQLIGKVESGERVAIVGKINTYTVHRHLRTVNGIEYYCCKGEDGLWRILGLAETHRYNGQVKELARNLKAIRKRCRIMKEDYKNGILADYLKGIDKQVSDMIQVELRSKLDVDESMKRRLSPYWRYNASRNNLLTKQNRRYEWLFPRVRECFMIADLEGRRVIILEPQDINLDETVCLRKLLDEGGPLDAEVVVWIVGELCRLLDFLLHGDMFMDIELSNIYVELSTQRLFLLDWSKILMRDYAPLVDIITVNGRQRCYRGADHFLVNIAHIGRMGLRLLGINSKASPQPDMETEEGEFIKLLIDWSELNLVSFKRSTYGIVYGMNDDFLEEYFERAMLDIWGVEPSEVVRCRTKV